MLDFLPSCFRRHKKKLLFLGGVVGGIAFFNTYIKRKFIEWESQRTSELCDQMQRANHFESTMITCDSLFISCAKKVRQTVIKEIEVDMVVSELKQNPPNKVHLWEQLKVLVFTQIIGEMYSHCLLCILLKVQMGVLSGYIFATRSTSIDATKQQKKYLSQIEDFLLNGVSKLLVQVQNVCTQKLKNYSLSQPLKLQDIKMIVTSIQEDISLTYSKLLPDISNFSLSPGSSKQQTDNFLLEISRETKDVLECGDFRKVLDICVECGISFIMDQMSECYSILSNSGEEFVNVNEFKTPMAKLIPVVHNMFSQSEPSQEDTLPHKLVQLEKLNNFAANIYEAFSQKR